MRKPAVINIGIHEYNIKMKWDVDPKTILGFPTCKKTKITRRRENSVQRFHKMTGSK